MSRQKQLFIEELRNELLLLRFKPGSGKGGIVTKPILRDVVIRLRLGYIYGVRLSPPPFDFCNTPLLLLLQTSLPSPSHVFPSSFSSTHAGSYFALPRGAYKL